MDDTCQFALLFSNNYKLESPLDSWNTAGVTTMQHLFYYDALFNSPLALAGRRAARGPTRVSPGDARVPGKLRN